MPEPEALTAEAETRRREITDAAASMFSDLGYHNVSMTMIAKRTGIKKSSLYHYIGSKEDLVFWIHETTTGVLLTRLRSRSRRRLGFELHLVELIADIIELIETHPGYSRVFFEFQREIGGARQPDVLARREEYVATVRKIFDDAVARDEMRADIDPQIVMMAIFGMSNWSYKWFRANGPLSAREIAQDFVSLLLPGLRPQPNDVQLTAERPPSTRTS